MKKIKEYLKNKNPYLLASAAIVTLSVGLIVALLQGESAEEQEIKEVIKVDHAETQNTIPVEKHDMETLPEDEGTETVMVETVWEEKAEDAVFESVGEEVREISESATKEEPSEKMEEVQRPIEVQENTEIREKEEDKAPEVLPEEEPDEKTDISETEVTETPSLEPHEHSWSFESYYQEPTCSNGGLVNQICAHCGETKTTTGVPTGDHLYEVEAAGDCCSVEVVICKECNHREVREKNLKNHIDVEDGFCYGCGQKTE